MTASEASAAPARAPYGWLVCLVLLALVLRVLYATRSGLWGDEALFLFVMRAPSLGALLDYLHFHESHPPLFYLLARGWQALVGPDDVAMLMLPVLLGAALVPALYIVGARVFSPRAGLLAAALGATSPILAEHASLMRPYSLLPLLTLLTCFALWQALQGSRAGWVAYAVLAGLLLLTHNYAWLVVGSFGLVSLIVLLQHSRPLLPGLLPWLLAHLGVLAIVAPWLPAVAYQLVHAGHAPGPVNAIQFPLNLFLRTFSSIPNEGAAAFCLLVLAACVAGALRRRRAAGEPRLGYALFLGVPLLTFLVSLLGSAHSNLLLPRTLLVVVPCALLALCAGLVEVVPARAQRLLTLLGVTLTGAYLASALFLVAVPKSDARELAAAVASKARPDDMIVIAPERMATGFNYYFKGTNPQIDYPVLGREGATPFNDLASRMADPEAFRRVKAALTAQRLAGRRIWFITEADRRTGPDGYPPGLPEEAGLPANVPAAQWNAVGSIRTGQVARELARLYGHPTSQICMPQSSQGEENLSAALFVAPAGSPRR